MRKNIEYTLPQVDAEKKQVLNFWKSFFPTVKSLEALDKLIHQISHRSLSDFYNEYIIIKESNNTEIEHLFNEVFNEIESKKLESILTDLNENNKWIYFFKPIISRYFKLIYNTINASNIINDRNIMVKRIIEQIADKLMCISYRTLIVETNIAKNEEKSENNNRRNKGSYFSNVLLQDSEYIKQLYGAYPELFRVMNVCARNITNYYVEILCNTEKEYNNICASINDERDLGKIVDIEIGKGDTHNNGKSVAKIMFNSGSSIIYKPRSLKMEQGYNKLINWVNNNIPEFCELKAARVYSLEKAGWMEYIENDECENKDEVNNFYIRMGELLCLLYTLNSRDCHCDNIIAKEGFPILIDLETLLHMNINGNKIKVDSIEEFVSGFIEKSVIGTALLPTLFTNNNTQEVMEIGGLGMGKYKVSPFKTQIIRNWDTDDVHIENIQREIPQSYNYPIYNGETVYCNEYLAAIREGFTNTYIWIADNKKIYLENIKNIFSKAKCRLVYKNTNVYAQLLETSYHPDLLCNKIDRLIYFHRIGLLIDQSKDFNERELYTTEIQEMMNGDIPIFSANPECFTIFSSNKEFVLNTYSNTIFTSIENKIRELGKMDMDRQIALVNGSFVGCKVQTDLPTKTDVKFQLRSIAKVNTDIIKQAKSIADILGERSLYKEICKTIELSWIGSKGFGDDFYQMLPVGCDIYQGNAGIALFLLHMGAISKETKYEDMGIKALHPIMRGLREYTLTDKKFLGLGAFTGITSYLYTFYLIIKHKLVDTDYERKLLFLIESELETIGSFVSEETSLDVLSGVSGCLGVLLSLYSIVSEKSKNIVIQICDEIVDKIIANTIYIEKECITWNLVGEMGYAHGDSGIITQLARYSSISKNKPVMKLIEYSLNYERKYKYNKKNGLWKIKSKAHYYSWCNGISGILLSKLVLVRCGYSNERLFDEIKALCNELKISGFGGNSSICHGDIGNLSILYAVADQLGDSYLREQCDNTLIYFTEKVGKDNWLRLKQIDNWGLMTGAAGIGLGLLTLRGRNIIESILCLE